MELRTTREMRRNEQLSKTLAKKADTADVSAQTQQAPKQQVSTDKVSISTQALAFLEEQNRRMWEQAQEQAQRRQARTDNSLSALEGGKQELELLGKGLKVLEICRKIAASIMKGNHVPPEDLKYLMENDPDGYKLAMAMRRKNPDPEDEKSVLEEEDKKSGTVEESGGEISGGEIPAVSAAGTPSGGDTSAAAE